MSNIIVCQRGYVNRVKFTPAEGELKDRLNLSIGGTLGFGKKKKSVTYDVTLWDKQAETLKDMIIAGDYEKQVKGSQVGFVGELEEVVTNVDKKDSSKIYTSLRVKPFAGQFQLLGGKPETNDEPKTKTALKESDEPTGKKVVDEEF